MNLLENKREMRNFIKSTDLMNSVNGGVRATDFSIEQQGDDLLVRVSNPSIDPKAFNFTIYNNQLIVNALLVENKGEEMPMAYPVFTKVINIPFFVDITKIEGLYENGEFRINLPYNHNLPDKPYPVKLRFLDNNGE